MRHKLLQNKQTLTNPDAARHGVRKIRIGAEEAGQRLDNYLTRLLKGVPKGHVYRLLRTGQVRINGGRRNPAYRLEAGDELRVPPITTPNRPRATGPVQRVASMLEEGLLYEDDFLLVVDKPSGLPVHGGSGLTGGLIEALRILRGEAGLELVHRLDRDTSGCLLIARRRSALRSLHAAFRRGEVEKRYLVLLAGRVECPFTVEAPLRRYVKRGGERHVAVAADGRAAVTRFRPLSAGEQATLAEAEPGTGRTHQIRVHAAHAGYPVAGDPRYGDKDANRLFREAGLARLALHAARLGFPHPRSDERMAVVAPTPPELASVIGRLAPYRQRNRT